MAIELRVPALGESITQATVGTWLKKEGDAVAADEPVVEVESEKATVALPAPSAGVLKKILKASGTNVAVGEVIGELEAGAAAQPSVSPSPPQGETAGERGTPAPAASPRPTSTPQGPIAAASTNGTSAPAARGPVRAPPSVRRLMAESGVEASAVSGEG